VETLVERVVGDLIDSADFFLPFLYFLQADDLLCLWLCYLVLSFLVWMT
jgi:hypothetical protein